MNTTTDPDSSYARYIKNRDRRKYGFILYDPRHTPPRVADYLRRWPALAYPLGELDCYFQQHQLPRAADWPGSDYADQLAHNYLAAAGYQVVRSVKYGRTVLKDDFKWTLVGYTDDAEVYVKTYQHCHKHHDHDGVVCLVGSVRAIQNQLFV